MDTIRRLKDISEIERQSSFILLDEYKNFLMRNEGYSDGALLIYDISELEETNRYMQIGKYVKDYIAIGDDGGGLVFLMKQDRKEKKVSIVHMSSLDVSDPYQIIEDFSEWQINDYPINEDKNEENTYLSEMVDIVLLKLPKDGTKSLLKIKKGLGLQYSIREILDITKKPPVVLKKNITRVKAQRLISATGYENLFEFNKK